jgi:hypothetical protein
MGIHRAMLPQPTPLIAPQQKSTARDPTGCDASGDHLAVLRRFPNACSNFTPAVTIDAALGSPVLYSRLLFASNYAGYGCAFGLTLGGVASFNL